MSTCLGGSFESFKLPRVASTQIIVFLRFFKDMKLQFQGVSTCLSGSKFDCKYTQLRPKKKRKSDFFFTYL
jgi:hypothetical protein